MNLKHGASFIDFHFLLLSEVSSFLNIFYLSQSIKQKLIKDRFKDTHLNNRINFLKITYTSNVHATDIEQLYNLIIYFGVHG